MTSSNGDAAAVAARGGGSGDGVGENRVSPPLSSTGVGGVSPRLRVLSPRDGDVGSPASTLLPLSSTSLTAAGPSSISPTSAAATDTNAATGAAAPLNAVATVTNVGGGGGGGRSPFLQPPGLPPHPQRATAAASAISVSGGSRDSVSHVSTSGSSSSSGSSRSGGTGSSHKWGSRGRALATAGASRLRMLPPPRTWLLVTPSLLLRISFIVLSLLYPLITRAAMTMVYCERRSVTILGYLAMDNDGSALAASGLALPPSITPASSGSSSGGGSSGSGGGGGVVGSGTAGEAEVDASLLFDPTLRRLLGGTLTVSSLVYDE